MERSTFTVDRRGLPNDNAGAEATMMGALPGPSENQGTHCDLCGCDVNIINAVNDEFGPYAICAGCAELWTTYLMHHPPARRYQPAEERSPRGRRPV
jgi:hypothetical protein